jgi:predicted aspartyl protease
LTISYTISKNRLKIKTRTLINTRANGYIFIDCKLAEKASQFLNILIQALLMSYNIKVFNNKKASLIIQYIKINLHINSYKQSKQPTLLV